jgi:hypothetical protein
MRVLVARCTHACCRRVPVPRRNNQSARKENGHLTPLTPPSLQQPIMRVVAILVKQGKSTNGSTYFLA